MRIRFTMLAAAMAVLAGCGSSESYDVGASQAYSKVLGAAMSESIATLPVGLTANDVSVRFQSIPTDRTAYWLYTKGGKEIGRVNVAVEGDEASSTVSYNYAEGEGAGEFDKIARQVKQHMPMLVTEAVDATIEARPVDAELKKNADKLTMMALMGDMMNDASSAMDQAVREQEQRSRMRDAERSVSSAPSTSTQPMMDLDGN